MSGIFPCTGKSCFLLGIYLSSNLFELELGFCDLGMTVTDPFRFQSGEENSRSHVTPQDLETVFQNITCLVFEKNENFQSVDHCDLWWENVVPNRTKLRNDNRSEYLGESLDFFFLKG